MAIRDTTTSQSHHETADMDTILLFDLYLTTRSIPDSLTNTFLRCIPFPSTSSPSPRLLRAIHLRRLGIHLSNPSTLLSPLTIASIEHLHSLFPSTPTAPLASSALLAVAAFLTLNSPDFAGAVAEHFGDRIGRILECPDAVGLASKQMRTVKAQFETAVGDPVCLDMLVALWGRIEKAASAVAQFVEKEWEELEKMGPPVLAQVAEVVAGESATENWEQADAATRVRFRAMGEDFVVVVVHIVGLVVVILIRLYARIDSCSEKTSLIGND